MPICKGNVKAVLVVGVLAIVLGVSPHYGPEDGSASVLHEAAYNL